MTIVSNQTSHSPATGVDKCAEVLDGKVPGGNLEASPDTLEARTRTLQTRLIAIREKYPTIAKGKSSIRPRDPQKDYNNEDLDPQPERPSNWSNVDEESTSDQHNVDPELIQSTGGPNNRQPY
ncbi:hypothetical protein M422DRAFT_269717 [Sphaerobolus stellatus SS14]|uniref:Uncharacterized protein n=1 Tax=Sphaerobolus stellatus (strain SS14) TaxID=990650 RepID=A0A0C9THI7_SPHS4|nr:hypothetical protein M422DRAFT_269717 [Sphaerobolus stellatus SS14]